jgi:WD40 repeat protein
MFSCAEDKVSFSDPVGQMTLMPDGEVLGFGDEQGHSTLPRSLLGCIHYGVSLVEISDLASAHVSVHPTLDVLVTGGRDASVRVWDMRTRANIFTLTGHQSTVADVKTQASDPQIISGSMDSTVR